MTKCTIKVPENYHFLLSQAQGTHGYMGLSAGKSLFMNREVMEAYTYFGCHHFKSFTFIIADLPKRFNLMALEGINEVTATYRSAVLGLDMERFMKKITDSYSRVNVTRWIDHVTDPNYLHNLDVLSQAYSSDDQFSFECNEFVWSFLSTPSNIDRARTSGNTIDQRVSLCKNYLLDELAMLIALPSTWQSTNVMYEIYPGRNNLQEKLGRNEFSFCKDLHLNPNRKFMEAYYEPSNS